MPTSTASWARNLREHSLSVSLGVLTVASGAAFFACKPGGHWYDFWNACMGGFLTALAITLLSKPFYERGADPTKPPEECE